MATSTKPQEPTPRAQKAVHGNFRLLKGEACAFEFLPTVATVSFYEGEPPIDYLRERVRSIVAANPFLAGKLIAPLPCTFLHVPKLPDGSKYFSVKHLNYAEDANPMWKTIEKRLQKEVCLCGWKAQALFGKLFKVSVVRVTPIKWALVFSMVHSLGDGQNFYQLHNMLDPNAEVYSLDFERMQGSKWQKILDHVYDTKAKGRIYDKFSTIAAGTINYFFRDLFQPPAVFQVQVDNAWLDKQKEAHKAASEQTGVPFVSTNDILTSWFWTAGQAYESGFMAINLRGKGIKELDERMAGNYQDAVKFCHEDMTPAAIRKALTCKAKENPPSFPTKGNSPGFNEILTFGLCTNWANFRRDVNLEGNKLILHTPFAGEKNMVFDGLCCIYSPFKGKTGLVIIERGRKRIASRRAALEETGISKNHVFMENDKNVTFSDLMQLGNKD